LLRPVIRTERVDAEIRVNASEVLASILLEALQPEADRPPSPRSRVSLEVEEGRLTMRFSASDTAALRAALNSYLRWAGAVLDLVERVR